MASQESTQLNNIRASYSELLQQVNVALRTQVGDATRLREVRSRVLALARAASQHQRVFPPSEYTTLQDSLTRMVADLDQACHQSIDPPDADPLQVIQIVRTGRRGRPPKKIQRQFLQFALEMRGPAAIARLLNCSSRHVRREALRLGLAMPGDPVFSSTTDAEGNHIRQHTTSTAPVSTLTDDELDQALIAMLASFPHFGRKLIAGNLRSQGHRVPDARIRSSYLRVRGVPAAFGQQIIVRKKYQVPGPNSLVHHNGQHGLIRWKLVIHCFIDGYSRFITGLRVHTNNRAETVLTLFLETATCHGVPSRVRGDHGTENIRVAEWMEEHCGLNRGSYIWGRSVHNTRIERLWYDVTRGFGLKWKNFFLELERCCGLDADNPAHIWLVHYLFLDAINHDAHEWAETWNAHVLHIKGERAASPRELFMFGMVRHGPRGIAHIVEPPHEDVADVAAFGIDWAVIDDPVLMAHHDAHNPVPPSQNSANPFSPAHGPEHFSEVACDPPTSPLSPAQIHSLNEYLTRTCDVHSRDMLVHCETWVLALQFVCQLFATV